MKILFPDWMIFGREDIASVLYKMGHKALFYKKELREYRYDQKFRSELRSFMKKQKIDLVFPSITIRFFLQLARTASFYILAGVMIVP